MKGLKMSTKPRWLRKSNPEVEDQPFETPYSRGRRPGFATTGKTRTKTNMQAETDVNNIVAKYRQTKILPNDAREALYGDFSEPATLLEANAIVQNAKAQFEALPAAARKKFDNDPLKLLEFVQDPANFDEGVTLGLFNKRQPEPPAPASGASKGERSGKTKKPPENPENESDE